MQNFFAVLFVFIVLIILPGFLLFNLIFKDKKSFNLLELIPLFFAFGLVFLMILGLPAYFLHFSYLVFFILWVIIVAMLLFLNIYSFITKRRDFILEPINYSFWITLVFVILSLLIVSAFFNVTIIGDRIFHEGVIRRLADSINITPYFNLFKDVPDKIDAGYGYNIWHFAGAIITRVSNLGVNVVWEYLILILTPIQVIAFGFFARKLFKNHLYYFVAMSLFFVFVGINTFGWEWRLSPYPDQVARNMVIPVLMGLWVLFLKKEEISKHLLVGIVSLGVVLTVLHLFSVIYFVIAVGGVTIFSFVTEKKYQVLKKGLLTLSIWLVAAAPILYLEYLNFVAVVPSNIAAGGSKTVAVGGYVTANPSAWQGDWMIVLASLLILHLAIRQFKKTKKISLPVLLCFALTFFAAFISFVPPVSNFFVKIITSTFLARLVSVVPVVLIFAITILEVINEKKNRRQLASVSVILIILIASLFKIGDFRSEMSKKGDDQDNLLSKNTLIFDYINQNIDPNAVIAADLNLSYALYATTNNYLVMVMPSHSPAIVDKRQRVADLNKILDPRYVIQNQAIFEKYQVDYIITEGGEAISFSNYPQILTLAHSFNNQENTTIYKVDRGQVIGQN